MPAADGKLRLTDAASAETLLRLVQSIPSPKDEPIKLWLAKECLDRAQRATASLAKHDRMVSVQDNEVMRAIYADRLLRTMKETALAAERAGLTPEKSAELLADES